MFLIVLPFSFVDGTSGIVKGSQSVPLTLNEIPLVPISLGILGPIRSPHDPHIRACPVLPENRAHVINNKEKEKTVKKTLWMSAVSEETALKSAVLPYLNSIAPCPDILLPHAGPYHLALPMSQVVPPFTRVEGTKRVAVEVQILTVSSSNAIYTTD